MPPYDMTKPPRWYGGHHYSTKESTQTRTAANRPNQVTILDTLLRFWENLSNWPSLQTMVLVMQVQHHAFLIKIYAHHIIRDKFLSDIMQNNLQHLSCNIKETFGFDLIVVPTTFLNINPPKKSWNHFKPYKFHTEGGKYRNYTLK